jgi:hypothetical protein
MDWHVQIVPQLTMTPPTDLFPSYLSLIMVIGNFAHGDYFIDCNGISQSFLRAIFGVWVTFVATIVAFCVHAVYRSRMR